MKPILLTAAGNTENQDRGLVVEEGSNSLLCVADGAGGRSGGTEAATLVVQLVKENGGQLSAADSCTDLLHKADEAIWGDSVAGETTCALAVVTPTAITGASVGDSGIWLIPKSGAHLDLTRAQQRKPFIGSGNARPMSFEHSIQDAVLLLATDGLLKYTSADRIIATCRQNSPEIAAERLIQLVRYPSGALPDDVTLILMNLKSLIH